MSFPQQCPAGQTQGSAHERAAASYTMTHSTQGYSPHCCGCLLTANCQLMGRKISIIRSISGAIVHDSRHTMDAPPANSSTHAIKVPIVLECKSSLADTQSARRRYKSTTAGPKGSANIHHLGPWPANSSVAKSAGGEEPTNLDQPSCLKGVSPTIVRVAASSHCPPAVA